MLDLTPYLQIADKLGVAVLGVLFIVALYKKWLVFGWHYTECDDARTICNTNTATRLTKAESDVERLRAERSRGHGD
jgi:hypothetical protein